jgi:hypothetical protein
MDVTYFYLSLKCIKLYSLPVDYKVIGHKIDYKIAWKTEIYSYVLLIASMVWVKMRTILSEGSFTVL